MKFLETVPPEEPKHVFELTQTEVDLIGSVLFDLTHDDALLHVGTSTYAPNRETLNVFESILKEFSAHAKNVEYDYLSNFYEV